MEQEHASSIVKSVRVPWNKGKLVGAKAPLRPGRTASTLNSRLKLRLSIRHLRLHYDTQTSCPRNQQQANLLVMGKGEKASLRQRLLGSTIDHVLRHALQPVLSVRDRTPASYRTMAIATDFSMPSQEVLTFFHNTKATVVHTYEEILHGLLASDRVTGELAERHKIEIREFAEKSMTEFVEEPRSLRPNLATSLEVGPPEVGLKSSIERQNPDLIVVGTHGRNGLRRAVIGSIAERLIAKLPRDILTVRPTD